MSLQSNLGFKKKLTHLKSMFLGGESMHIEVSGVSFHDASN